MSGATLQQIADRLGYNSRQAVFKATTSLLERQEQAVSEQWRAFHLARLERLLLAVWQDALDGDDRAGQQALRIVQQIGRTTGVTRSLRVEVGDPVRKTTEPTQLLTWLPDDEWTQRYSRALEELHASLVVGGPAEDDL